MLMTTFDFIFARYKGLEDGSSIHFSLTNKHYNIFLIIMLQKNSPHMPILQSPAKKKLPSLLSGKTASHSEN
ncbi:hypothetical protein D0466_19670 [Peribacillus glennii]|uniref:Uncharacterized protein n=1 Tax=Peribacillus glennii TaxID=2303991 RepID=A0A372L784_9BACI|nr:hypothetical protein D0466_19670 [Peribacillus glennii]